MAKPCGHCHLRSPTKRIADPDRLVGIHQNGANPDGLDASSYPADLDIAQYSSVFTDTTTACVPRDVTYQYDGALRPAVVEQTTATHLSALGLQPQRGRWCTTSEDRPGAAVVAVIGHQAWQRTFRGDPSIIGRAIRIEGVPVTIIGVGPAGHTGTFNVGITTDFWLPVSSLPALGVELACRSGGPWRQASSSRPASGMMSASPRLRRR